jgi:hypothetical protein
VEQRERPDDRDRGEHEVDIHAVAPAQGLREHAAEDQADRRTAAGDRAPDAKRLVALGAVAEGRRQQRHRGRGEQRGECALERPRGGQHAEGLRRAADRRGEREPGESGDEGPLAPEQVADPSAQQQQAAEGERVSGHDPLPLRIGEMQRPLRRRQRDVHDRRVEHDHQLGQREDQEDRPALCVVWVLCGHSRAPEVVNG